MLGVLSHRALLSQMRAAGIFVSPALYEPFGLCVLEAALSGCALVLSDIASFRELWGGAALFVDPRDSGAIATALNLLCRDHEVRQRLQHAARERARRYPLHRTADAYLQAYHHVIERHRPLQCSRTAGASA
jgi:glycosyltransferase involved in cell wall biosynthesis